MMVDDMNMRDMVEVPDGIYRIMASLVRFITHTGFFNIINLSAGIGVKDDGWPTEDEFYTLHRWMYGTKSKDKEEA